MAKKKRPPRRQPKVTAPPATSRYRRYLPAIGLALAVLVFYWTPLTSPQASIQWDAVDCHYSRQKYFSDEIGSGRMPFWTAYVFSGFPFLADMEVGAWYPLNWPFFLAGIVPRSLQVELLVHALLACFGAYLLARHFLKSSPAALVSSLCYGLSGYFAGVSSHIAKFQIASLLPWLLYLFCLAFETGALRYVALATLLAGSIVLVGFFQTALYSFLALALVALSLLIRNPRQWRRVVAICGGIAIGAVLLSSVQALPGLELLAHSIRSRLSATTRGEGMIPAQALLTLFYPNYYGALDGPYRGPEDITQFYFYAGMLLVPLAVLGLRHRRVRLAALLLILPCLWYAAGPQLGLYSVMARLPGFASIRAPVNIWFVPALGLALLAGAGIVILQRRWPVPWLPVILIVIFYGDLWYWNSEQNPLAYARSSFAELYGSAEERFQRLISTSQPALTRFMAPERVFAFGPLNHPLDIRLEATYGYNAFVLTAYQDYVSTMERNPKLKNGLNVGRYLNLDKKTLEANPDVLPRVYFPKQVQVVADMNESRDRLSSLDPAQTALVMGLSAPVRQGAGAVAEIVEYRGDYYRIRYRTPTDSLLRISVPYFPGWRARAGNTLLRIYRTDHALMGVLIPAGEGELVFQYRPTYFTLGAALSLCSLAACLGLLFYRKPARS